MQYNPINIVTGIIILYLVSYLLITLFTFIYLRLSKNKTENKKRNIFLATALVSLAWLVSTFVSVLVAATSGVLIFAIFSLLLIFGGSYFFAERMLDFNRKENIIYSVVASIIFNPVWLTFLGIL